MFNIQRPHPTAQHWQDSIPGEEGNNGFWWDTPTERHILIHGTWWDSNPNAPQKGKGDLWADLEVWPRPFLKSSAHGGFVRYAQACVKTLTDLGLLATPLPISISGHSLGAAIAALVSLQLRKEGFRILTPYLYACPSCWGRKALVKQFRAEFPDCRNQVVGWDYTQFLHLLTPTLGPPAPKCHYKAEGFHPIKDHWPWRMAAFIKSPSETLE